MRDIYNLLYRAVHDAPSGASPKQLADALGVKRNTLIKRVNADYPERSFYVEDIPALTAITGDDAPLHFLCEKSGGVFLRTPQVESAKIPVHVACMDAVNRFGELMSECSAALADGRITHEESDQLADAGYKAVHEILRLLKTAERNVR